MACQTNRRVSLRISALLLGAFAGVSSLRLTHRGIMRITWAKSSVLRLVVTTVQLLLGDVSSTLKVGQSWSLPTVGSVFQRVARLKRGQRTARIGHDGRGEVFGVRWCLLRLESFSLLCSGSAGLRRAATTDYSPMLRSASASMRSCSALASFTCS